MGTDQADERRELAAMVRQFLADRSDEHAVRQLMETADGYDTAVWREMAGLGLTGLAIPEEFGGAGRGPGEVGIVMEEAGGALLCAPYFSTVVLAANTLLCADDEHARSSYLPRIADGSLTATLAISEPAGVGPPERAGVSARRSGADWVLDGTVTFVPDGHSADLVLVAADTSGGQSLFAVDGDVDGVSRTPLETLDLTRKLATLAFSGVTARLVGVDGGASKILHHILDLAAVELAAEQVGGAQRVLDTAVEYAKTRTQFGRPIGSFQAVKHRLADILVDVVAARSAARYGIRAADRSTLDSTGELPTAASVAKAFCSEAYVRVATESIQILGGVGFTWEHPAHLYFRRAHATRALLGDPDQHRFLLADRIGI